MWCNLENKKELWLPEYCGAASLSETICSALVPIPEVLPPELVSAVVHELGYLTRVFCLGDFLHSIAKKPEFLATAVEDLYSLIVDLILSIFIYSYLFLFIPIYSIYFIQILFSNLSWIISYPKPFYIVICNVGLSPVKGRFPWDGVHWEILMIAERVIHYGGLSHYSSLHVNDTPEQVWQWRLLNHISWKRAINHVWLEFSL